MMRKHVFVTMVLHCLVNLSLFILQAKQMMQEFLQNKFKEEQEMR